MKARVLYIPGRGIRWAEHEGQHVSTEMHTESPPTVRGGRLVTVRVVEADGSEISIAYAEGLYCERVSAAGERSM